MALLVMQHGLRPIVSSLKPGKHGYLKPGSSYDVFLRTLSAAAVSCSFILRSLTLCPTKDGIVRIRDLPWCITKLTIRTFYPERFPEIDQEDLPPNLTKLYLLDEFNQPLDISKTRITRLKVGRHFDQRLERCLPATLDRLSLAGIPCQPLSWIPCGLTRLDLEGSEVDHPADNLPPALTHLKLGDWFTHPVDKLPVTLIHLSIGSGFDDAVDQLPPTLTHLTLGDNFDQPVDKLPPTLTHFVVGHRFNQRVTKLPRGLVYLKLGIAFDQPVRKLPPELRRLDIGAPFWAGTIGMSEFNQPIDALPDRLSELRIYGTKFDQPVSRLPTGMTRLRIICWCFSSQLLRDLPPALTHLDLISRSYQDFPETCSLPLSLTHMQRWSNGARWLGPDATFCPCTLELVNLESFYDICFGERRRLQLCTEAGHGEYCQKYRISSWEILSGETRSEQDHPPVGEK